jgi:hypothetical protein
LRDRLSFGEVPIKLYLKRRSSEDQRDEIDALADDRSQEVSG